MTASSAVPVPTTPPPTTSTSSSPGGSIAASASSRACGLRALDWLMPPSVANPVTGHFQALSGP